MVAIATNLVFLSKIEFPLILVARQRTLHLLYLFSIRLLPNIANKLFDTTGEIKWFKFEMILNSWLLSQKCGQCESTSLRDSLQLPSNSTLKRIRHQLLYAMKPEGSVYMSIMFQSKVPTQSKDINQLSVIFD